jgi:hypothetical protein
MKKSLLLVLVIILVNATLSFGQSNLFPSSGNVGIGTVNPAYKLDAVGNSFYFGSHFNNTTSTNLNIGAGVNANSVINFGYYGTFDATIWNIGRWGADQSFRISNYGSGSEFNVLTALSSGNIGIGTTTPQFKLDLVGGKQRIYNGLSTNDYTNVAQHNGQFRIMNGLGTLQSKALEIALLDNGTGVIQANESGVGYNNLALNPVNGNVGIGTIDPKNKLDIEGGLTVNETHANGVRFSRSYDVHGHIYVDQSQGYLLNYMGYYGHKFQTSNGEAFRIAQNRNIGIGTTNPDAKLEVYGNSTEGSNFRATGNNARLIVDYNNTGYNYYDAGLHIFRNFAGSEKIRFDGNTGNVGIGTPSPNSKLEVKEGKIIAGTRMAVNGATVLESQYEQGSANGSLSVLGTNTSSGGWIMGYAVHPKANVYDKFVSSTPLSLGRSAIMVESDVRFMTASEQSLPIGIDIELSEKMRIANNGNVGIGTKTPETPLHLFGGPAMTTGWNKTLTLQATYPTIIFNSNSQKWGGIGYDFSSNMNFWVGGSSNELATTATAAMSITQNGNIGIGTTNPTAKLEIASTTGSGLKLSGLSQTNGQQGVPRNLGINDAGEVIVTNNNNPTTQPAPSNVSLTSLEKNVLFYAHKRFKCTQTGSAKLDENILFDGSFYPSYTSTAPTESDPTVILLEDLPQYHVQRGVWIGWSTRYWPSTKFKIEIFDTWNYSGNANYNKWITIADETNYSGSDYKVFLPTSSVYPVISKIRFTFYNGTGSDGRLGVSELFYMSPEASTAYDGLLAKFTPDGNLGVGTDNPTQKLDVNGTALLRNGNDGDQNTKNQLLFGWNGTPSYLHSIKTRHHSGIASGNAFDFYVWKKGVDGGNIVGTQHVMTLNGEGNVGVGTTTPFAPLHVVGGINSGIRLTGKSARFTLTDDVTNLWNIDNTGGTLRFFREDYNASSFGSNGQLDMVISKNGNIGIGIPNPTQKLSVAGQGVFTSSGASIDPGDGAGSAVRIGYSTAGDYGYILSNNTGIAGKNLILQSNGNGGNVGIGTLTPTSKLHVDGTFNLGGVFKSNDYGVSLEGASAGLFFYGTSDAKNRQYGLYHDRNTEKTVLRVNNNDNAFVFSKDGLLSIGATNMPTGYKLAVGGDIIAERVVVKLQANWPDYVFKTGYSLRPLSEIEAFVKTNNHLPDVPSEAEIKEKGIDVEHMNATLLKKVEELTLYLIEIKKENMEMKKQNEALQKRMDSLEKK